ncbi:MAG: hypothetical protein QXL15_04260 [Candidatus Korarchaeota archaeon]
MIDEFSDRLVKKFDELGVELVSKITENITKALQGSISDDLLRQLELSLRDLMHSELSKISEALVDEATYLANDIIKKSRIERPHAEKKTEFVDAERQELIRKIDDLTYRLNRLFNLLINFEPRIQILPVLEERGEVSIEELSLLLRIDENKIREFVEYMEKSGFVRKMPGNRYRLTRSITR